VKIAGADCKRCPLRNRTPVLPQPFTGQPKFIFAGQSPGISEEIERRYFCGWSGNYFDLVLEKLDIPRRQLYVCNVLLCRADDLGPAERRRAIECCSGRLWNEVKRFKCKTVLAAGMDAMWAFMEYSGTEWIGPVYDVEEGRYKGWHVLPTLHPAFVSRFRGYGPVFTAHLERIWKYVHGELPPWKWPPIEVEENDRAKKLLTAILHSRELVAFDVENIPKGPEKGKLLCLGVGDTKRAVSLDWPIQRRDLLNLILKIHASKKVRKVAQFGQHDTWILGLHDIAVGGYVEDTLPMHQTLAPEMSQKKLGHDLGFVGCIHWHMPRYKTEFGGDDANKYVNADPTERKFYNARDCVTTALNAKAMLAELEEDPVQLSLYRESFALGQIAIKMKRVGLLADGSRYARHDYILRRRQRRAGKLLRKIARKIGFKDFNPGSGRQLQELFFKKLKVVPTRYSKKTGAPSLKEEALLGLLTHPKEIVGVCARLTLAYRRWVKLRGFLKKLPRGGGRIHPSIRVNAARSGRWIVTEPPLTTLPKPVVAMVKSGPNKGKKRVVAPGMRDVFVAAEGWTIVEADYKQLEQWILSVLADDTTALGWRAAGLDIHRLTAAAMLGLTPEAVTKPQREFFKRFRYGHNYRGSDRRLHAVLVPDFPDVTLEQVHHFRDLISRQHPRIVLFQDRLFEQAKETDCVVAPISGRVKRFYGQVKITEVCNYPIQMTAADLINRAIREVDREFGDWSVHRILLQIHDALLVETRKPKQAMRILKNAMERPVILNNKPARFEVDFKVGPSWGELQEVEFK
jgi:DNA polymerase-1